ncbi:MAG: acyloxyacyl hydrolase [Melioribacter sp.]|nr:acyloxyacyl hydrolase [Melioribacter sp.]
MINRICHYILISLALNFIFLNNNYTQTDLQETSKNKIGFSFSYGDQEIKILGFGIDFKVDYSYEIFFAQFHYMYSILYKNPWEVSLILQTEYGITYYKPNKKFQANMRSHEIGMGAGFIFSFNLINDFISTYFLVSTGPHYSQKSPDRQVSGFMFNSNLDIGVIIYMQNNLSFDIRTGFRHLSNANLKIPNGGINNWIISFGILYNL